MTTVNFTTDITGANNPISSSSTRTFNFTLNNTYTIGKGSFDMKRGNSSLNGVTATIYSGLNGSGSSIVSVFLPSASFSTSFTVTDFTFNYVLASGQYSLILTTTDDSGGSTQYSIKTDSFKTVEPVTGNTVQLFDAAGTDVTPTSTPTPTPTSTPTPTPTNTPLPATSTPTPTNTPIPATSTPTPTNLTPTPTPLINNKLKNHGHSKLGNRGDRFIRNTKRFFSNVFYRIPGSGYFDHEN